MTSQAAIPICFCKISQKHTAHLLRAINKSVLLRESLLPRISRQSSIPSRRYTPTGGITHCFGQVGSISDTGLGIRSDLGSTSSAAEPHGKVLLQMRKHGSRTI